MQSASRNVGADLLALTPERKGAILQKTEDGNTPTQSSPVQKDFTRVLRFLV